MRLLFQRRAWLPVLLLLAFSWATAQAQTVLRAGDIAFVGFNTDPGNFSMQQPDPLAFITLTNLAGGTSFNITDNGVQTSGALQTVSNTITWTAPAGGTPVGTVVRIEGLTASSGTVSNSMRNGVSNTIGIYQSNGGDQLLAYQGPASAPVFLGAIEYYYSAANLNPATGWQSTSASNTVQQSLLPPGLTTGVNCVVIATSTNTSPDNFKYTGTLTGTACAIRTAIATPSNWSISNGVFPALGTPYNITPAGFGTTSITAPPAAPTGSASQSYATGSTVANLMATGTAIQWYAASTGGAALASTTPLTTGTTYYGTQTVNGCESSDRLAVTVTLTAANQAPTNLALSNSTLAENVAAGSTVGSFSSTDPNAGNTHTYALVSGTGSTDNAAFTLTPAGVLTINASPDFETQPSYSIRVQTTDQGGLTFAKAVTVTITDVNEVPVINNQSRSIAENSANGTNVGAALTASDVDAGTTLTYAITGGNAAGKFAINSSTGQLTVAGGLDFETTNSYALTVQVSDGTLTDNATVTVSVTNVNETPTNLTLSNNTLAENVAAGTTVGTFSVTDPDAGDTHTYAFFGGVGSTGNSAFSLTPAGVLTINASPNFESQSSYSIRVNVTDAGGLTATRIFTITITNVNEAPVIANQTRTIAENSANGTLVGAALTATDVDAGTTLTYAITAGNTGGAFAINSSGQLTVANVAQLDFETTPIFTLTVQVSDGALTDNATVTVNLTDVNEAPVINNQTRSIAENSPNGTLVGAVLVASDVDAGTTLTYSITAGNTGGAFALNPGTGQLTVANVAQLDFETTPIFTLTVQVSDGALTDNATITINLTDVAEAVDLTLATPGTIPGGLYNNITLTGTGTATLAGAATVNGSLSVPGGITLNTNCQVIGGSGSFALLAGATLRVCSPQGLSASGATGAVQVTGSRSFSADASYVYDGTAAQATGTGLPAQVRNLTTANNNPLTLTQPLAVDQALTLANAGNLALNGQPLTLLSDATGTALVVNSGTGVVSGGTATVQRYIDPSLNPGLGYRHYSSPVSGNTLSDLSTGSFTPVFNPAYNASPTPGTATPFPTVFGYDQARLATAANNLSAFDKGWFSPAAATDALTTGQGYTVNLAGTEQVDFTGTLNTGDYARTLARNAAGTPNAAESGWHLVGNPYPAPLDFALVAPADRAGLDAAVYVFESSSQYAGSYRASVNGVGGNANSGSALIGSAQGFFVRVSSGQPSGTLTFRNSQRLTDYAAQVPVRRGTADTRPLVQLRLQGGSAPADALFVYVQAGATPGFDAEFDAVKRANPTGLNLAAATAAGEALAIQGLPVLTAATVVPLTVDVPATGAYAFTAPALNNLPATTRVELVDHLTGTRQNLRTLPAAGYAFTASATRLVGRFALNLTPAGAPLATNAQALAAQVRAYPNPAHDRLTLVRPTGAAASAELVNALGQVVRRFALPTAETSLDLRALATGVYVLRLSLDGQPVSKRVVID